MATNEQVLSHLAEVRASVIYAVNTVNDWQKFGSKLTDGNKATELAKITTVPTERQHASDCAICTAWDGTTE
tara:strand:+ start:3114 stop:3329 length:216 start_codon:yes stop_codon:yes gene_type:complete